MFQKQTALSKLLFKFLQDFTFLAVEFRFTFNFCTSASAHTFQLFFSIEVLVEESIMKKFRSLDYKRDLTFNLNFGLFSKFFLSASRNVSGHAN